MHVQCFVRPAVTDSHRVVSMIIHSVHNNPRSLSCTAANCDLSLISIPTDMCKRSYSHTHTICYVQDKMAFDLHPIICTWDVVTMHLHSSHHFVFTWGVVMLEKEKRKKKGVESGTYVSSIQDHTKQG